MVTTRMSDAVPMTMPSEVRIKRTLLTRKVSMATLRVSPKTSLGYRRLLPFRAIARFRVLLRQRRFKQDLNGCPGSRGFRDLGGFPFYRERTIGVLRMAKRNRWLRCSTPPPGGIVEEALLSAFYNAVAFPTPRFSRSSLGLCPAGDTLRTGGTIHRRALCH